MAFNDLELQTVRWRVNAYVQARRPPKHLRDQVDLAFRIKGQSVEIFELRPAWRKPGATIEIAVAKSTYVRTQDVWRIYWMRRDLKWHTYAPHPEARSVNEFLEVVEADDYGCFFG